MNFERSERFGEREKAALAYTSTLVWDPASADDALWQRLKTHFSDEELVELGYFVALTFGQQRWIKTLGIGHGEVLNLGSAGLSTTEAEAIS